MKEIKNRKRKGFGLFAMAAALYTMGIISFCIWSYFQQRNNLLEKVDQSLINATYATEQILGEIFITCAVETEAPYTLGYITNQKNLNRFADDCNFNLIGAIGHKDEIQWELICGGNGHEARRSDITYFQDSLRTELFHIVEQLSHSEHEAFRIYITQTDANKELRIAIRYHHLSSSTGYAILVARNTQDINRLITILAWRAVGMGIFLYAMAFPLILLYHYAQARSSQETSKLNTLLQQDYTQLKEREAELEDAIHDLERFNAVSIGREGRIIELKAEVNTLLEQMKQTKRYNVDHVE